MVYPYSIRDGILDNHNGCVDEDGNLLLAPDGLCMAQYDDPADHATVRDTLRIANADSGIETAFALDIILEHSLL
jgi:hypothetical protein